MNGKHIKEKVYQLLDERAEEYFRYLGEFLHHPSTLGQEESAQQYYAELLQNLGLEVDLWYPQPQDMAVQSLLPALPRRLCRKSGRCRYLQGLRRGPVPASERPCGCCSSGKK